MTRNLKKIICSVWFLSVLIASIPLSTSDELSQEMKEAMEQLKKLITEETITEGGFKNLTIGQPKSSTITPLVEIGVKIIEPTVTNHISAYKASGLHHLKDSNSIVAMLQDGMLRVTFSGNTIQKISIPPFPSPERKQLFDSLKTRAQVFKMLEKEFEPTKHEYLYVPNTIPDERSIGTYPMSTADLEFLEKHDAWEMVYDNKEGYWYLLLKFKNNQLKEITYKHSPVELP